VQLAVPVGPHVAERHLDPLGLEAELAQEEADLERVRRARVVVEHQHGRIVAAGGTRDNAGFGSSRSPAAIGLRRP
jgi:hypothetical protein